MGCFFNRKYNNDLYNKIKAYLACMLGMTLTGCGSSRDSTSSVEPSEVMVKGLFLL